MAIWGLGIMVAPIVGPTVGGWITENYSWRWIFYMNLPFGALALALGSAFLTDAPRPGADATISRFRFDGLGLALLVAGIGALQVALDQGERLDWFESSAITTLVDRGRRRAHGLRDLGAACRPPARGSSGPREPHLRARHLPHLRHRFRALLELPAAHLLYGAPPAVRRAHCGVGTGAGRRGLADLAGDRRDASSTASTRDGSSRWGPRSSPTRSTSWAR